jgi:hypothetical protein
MASAYKMACTLLLLSMSGDADQDQDGLAAVWTSRKV